MKEQLEETSTILCGVIRGSFIDRVTLDWKPEGRAGSSKMQRPSGGICLACVRNSRDTRVARAE